MYLHGAQAGLVLIKPSTREVSCEGRSVDQGIDDRRHR